MIYHLFWMLVNKIYVHILKCPIQLTCEIDAASNRIKGKCVSHNVFNLSRWNITNDKLSLLSKGLSFVPTPERIDQWQVKNDSEIWQKYLIKNAFLNVPSP